MSQSISKILRFAAPTSAEAMAFTLVGVLDHFFVTFLTTNEAAAASLTAQLSFMAFLGLIALSIGATVITGRLIGRGDETMFFAVARRVIGRLALISGAVAAICALFPQLILSLLGADDAVIAAGTRFFQIIAVSLPFMVLSEVTCRLLRNTGDVRTPTMVGLVVLLSNLVLNYVCIFGIGPVAPVGLIGVALSTLVVRAAGFAYLLIVLRGRQSQESREHGPVQVPAALAHEDRKIALPSAALEVTRVIAVIALTAIYLRIGVQSVIAGQMIFTIELFFLTSMVGFCSASFFFIGKELGNSNTVAAREQADKVIKGAVLVAVLAMPVAALAALSLPYLYSGVAAETAREACYGLLLLAAALPAKCCVLVLRNGVLRAGGNTGYLLRVETMALPITIGAAWIFGLQMGFGLLGALAAVTLVECAKLVVYLQRLRQPAWIVQFQL